MFGWLRKTFANVLGGLTGVTNPAEWFVNWVRGDKSDAGVTVNAETTIGWAPVWYAVSKIAGHVSTLPLTVYRRLSDGGVEKASDHPAFRLVRTRPNPFTTAAHLKETLMVHALLYGNGKVAVIRSNGRPTELILIPADRSVTAYVDGEKWHGVRVEDDDRLEMLNGTEGSHREQYKWIIIPDRDVIHVPGLSLDGTVGLEIFKVSQGTIGLGLAAEKAASKDFANGSRPSMLLEAPTGVLSDEKRAQEFMRQFNTFHAGPDNAGKAALLRDGIKATALPTSNRQAQWHEQRVFQRQEVALLFQLESILGDDDSVSYGSAEAKTLAYLSNCLMRWLVRIEQECDEKLLSRRQKAGDTHYFKFNTASLLRSDFKTTIEALGLAITHRIMNPNEAREKLDMNPYDGGDEYFNPAITPGDGTEEAGGGGAAEPPTPEEANNRAVVARLRHLIGVEKGHVLNAAGNKRNYAGYLDGLYQKWGKTLGNAIEELGGARSLADAHCEQSQRELLEILQTVPTEGMADAVFALTEKWEDRAEPLAHAILNGEPVHV